MRQVLNGGVADAKSIPPALLQEMYVVGNRPGHYRAFLSLLRNSPSWEEATKGYGRIPEREHDRKLISGAEMTTISGGGHFLPLDRPQDVIGAISRFAAASVAASAW
jgi:hypothetical protein